MMKKTFLTSLLSLAVFFVMGLTLVSAQGGNTGGTSGGNPGSISGSITNPLAGGTNSISGLITIIIDQVVLPIGGVLAVLAFIYSGFLYVIAQGNETKIQDAHRALLYTSIGTAVLLGSWVLAKVLCSTIAQLGGPACPV